MVPSIPDNFHKILISIGLVIFGWGFFYLYDKSEEHSKVLDRYEVVADSLYSLITQTSERQKEILEQDSIYRRDSLGLKTIEDVKSVDISKFYAFLSKHTQAMSANHQEIMRLSAQYDDNDRKYERYSSDHVLNLLPFAIAAFIGAIIFLVGFSQLANIQKLEILHKLRTANGQLIAYERCQSCGIKFNAMNPYGVNQDDSYNTAFCKNCYNAGMFTEPSLTAEEVLLRIKNTIGHKRFKEKYWTGIVNNLDRWEKDKFSSE
jgi:hypothetical protein